MALTRHFKETLAARVQNDPAFAQALLDEAITLATLRDDVQRMIGAGMLIGEPPAFDALIDRLRTLETAISGRTDAAASASCGPPPLT